MRNVFLGLEDEVLRASAAAQAVRASGSQDLYKKREDRNATGTHSKAMHAYDVARPEVERAVRRRYRGAYDHDNGNLTVEAQDHRQRRVETKVYLALPYGVDEFVDHGAHALRVRGCTKEVYLEADSFRTIPSVFSEAARYKKNRIHSWVYY